MKKQPKRTLLSVLLTLTLAVMPYHNQSAHADTKNFGQQFNMMWNHTQASTKRVNGAYGASLGGLNVRSPIKNWQIVSFSPPNFKAGCGGIDMHFGSFSFISTENIKELIRNIMANAMGYAVRLALKNVCSSCDDIMKDYQKMVHSINANALNTCQMSSKAVDWVNGKFNPKNQGSQQEDEAREATEKGKDGDYFASMANVFRRKNEKDATPNANRDYNAHNKDTAYGNNLLNTLVSANVFSQDLIDTKLYGGDKQFFEITMSLIGTNIMRTGAAKDSKPDRYVEPIWTFDDLVGGTRTDEQRTILTCTDLGTNISDTDTNKCQEVGMASNTWLGVERYVVELLAGKQANNASQVLKIEPGSIMAYLQDAQSVTLQGTQVEFLNAMPPAYRMALTQAAQSKYPEITRAATQSAAKSLSKQLAAHLAHGIVQTTRQSYNAVLKNKENSDLSDRQKEALNKLERAALRVEEESNKNAQEFLASIEYLTKSMQAIEANANKKDNQ